MIDPKRLEILPTFSRNAPLSLLVFVILTYFFNPTYHNFYIVILMILLFPLNMILKYIIFKPIYKLFNKTTLPILGLGSRPPGAVGCDISLVKKNTNFGFPSGHAQIVWTFGIYSCFKFYKTFLINKDTYKPVIYYLSYIFLIMSFGFCFLIMLYVSYSRVYIEKCHTIQQVIAGSIIGATTGFLAYYYEDYILSKI